METSPPSSDDPIPQTALYESVQALVFAEAVLMQSMVAQIKFPGGYNSPRFDEAYAQATSAFEQVVSETYDEYDGIFKSRQLADLLFVSDSKMTGYLGDMIPSVQFDRPPDSEDDDARVKKIAQILQDNEKEEAIREICDSYSARIDMNMALATMGYIRPIMIPVRGKEAPHVVQAGGEPKDINFGKIALLATGAVAYIGLKGRLKGRLAKGTSEQTA